jgi:hypothetical protein
VTYHCINFNDWVRKVQKIYYLNVWNVSDPILEVNAVYVTSVSRGSLIVDSFRTDIGDRQAFLDEDARWKTRWNMVDGQKPQTLLETLNVTNLSCSVDV